MTITSRQKEASSLTGPSSEATTGRASQLKWPPSQEWPLESQTSSQRGLRANLQFIHTGSGSKAKSSSLSVQRAEGTSPPGTPSPTPSLGLLI